MADKTRNQVLSLVADIVKKRAEDEAPLEDAVEENAEAENATKPKDVKLTAIRGKPKSGRFWKSQKEKFSTINKTKGLQQDFAKKTLLRLELKRTKALSRKVLEEFKQKELLKKERRKENLRRTEENMRKAEVVQVITNTKKLKRMKKKQLRFIEKRDTSNIQANK